jgi:hypothetical protein
LKNCRDNVPVCLIALIVAFLILPLVAQRRDFWRLIKISIVLQAIKYLLFYVVFPLKSMVDSPLLSLFAVIAMFPELWIGPHSGSRTIKEWLFAICLGIVWNLPLAYFFSWMMFKELPFRSDDAATEKINITPE